MKNIYFVSDAHFAPTPESRQREKELCQWLDSIAPSAHAVVFLGDIFDFWFTYAHVVPRVGMRILGKMASLADQGVELHFFLGNHDMWLFDYLQQEMPITIHSDPTILTFGQMRMLVGHGDGLVNFDWRYNLLRRCFRNRFCQWLCALMPQWLVFSIAFNWIGKKRRSYRKPQPTPNKENHNQQRRRYTNAAIARYCRTRLAQEDKPVHACLFGHSHQRLARTLNITPASGEPYKSQFLNIGDWLEFRQYAVVNPDTFSVEAGDFL